VRGGCIVILANCAKCSRSSGDERKRKLDVWFAKSHTDAFESGTRTYNKEADPFCSCHYENRSEKA
jgi:hypothetical protein